MTATNYSYPEDNWKRGTEHDELPLPQAAVDRALSRQISRFVQANSTAPGDEEAAVNFNTHIMLNAPLLYDRVTFNQITAKFYALAQGTQ